MGGGWIRPHAGEESSPVPGSVGKEGGRERARAPAFGDMNLDGLSSERIPNGCRHGARVS
jgi:hypothetical protein